ncbi:hypothetical protein ABB37_04115 [Leptomonas pyrrhocoris]|uniref:Uncharacterized protein n=1 Tax=Leptomonas pyrrhocoris TaxID=157538 RepID=A0A0N0VFU1_LEPPY|nr:hypothetical protein ABB37_04115 [Leptomonas pyrrhocoris]KPA81861.1 hypothetical protein ABB37_04115 [Leptomonas pyrrhocoris]|eukprot:XP_015660300.1 hypothetical protein ABB37_04115 [Leptomonas pyrrhocoris]
MVTFDSVSPDTAVVTPVPAKVFRYVQTWLPFALQGLAVLLYAVILCINDNTRHAHAAKLLLLFCFLLVLLASFLRRLSPFLFSEIGCYRYDRVSGVVTRLLPNTRQSWIAVMTLAVVTMGLPLYMYLFTHYTCEKYVYGFAMFSLSRSPWSIFFAAPIGLLLCGAVMCICGALVMLPLGGRNALYVAEWQNRLRVWIRLVSWLPLTLLLLTLFLCGRALQCNGPLGRFGLSADSAACRTGLSLLGGCVVWLFIAVAYIGLDVGLGYVRFLGGGPIGYYALEPRVDGLFCELLVWTLKVTAAMVTLVDPIAADLAVAVLFSGLFAFACFRHTATVEVLEELIRCSVLTVAVTCVVSLCVTSQRIPAVVTGLVVLLCWVGTVGAATAFYLRRFGWAFFGSGREVTADIIVL